MFGFGKKKNQEANALPSGNEAEPKKEGGLFSRLKQGLAKTGGAITEGMENTSPMTVREQMKFKYLPIPDPMPCLAYLGNEETMRLACMTKVEGDVVVETKPEVNMFGENFFS